MVLVSLFSQDYAMWSMMKAFTLPVFTIKSTVGHYFMTCFCCYFLSYLFMIFTLQTRFLCFIDIQNLLESSEWPSQGENGVIGFLGYQVHVMAPQYVQQHKATRCFYPLFSFLVFWQSQFNWTLLSCPVVTQDKCVCRVSEPWWFPSFSKTATTNPGN